MWMMSMVEILFFSSDVFPYGVLRRICRSWNVAWNVDPNTGSWTIHQGRILQASIRSCWLAGCHSGTQGPNIVIYCDILWSFVIQRNHDRVRHTVDMFHSFPVRIIVWFKKGIRQREKCLFLCQECVSFVSVSVCLCVCVGTCLYFNARQLFQHGSIKWSSLVRWVISASMLHQSLLRGERRHSFEVEA